MGRAALQNQATKLSKSLKDVDVYVRRSAGRALSSIGGDALAPHVAALTSAVRDDDPEVARLAFVGLHQLDPAVTIAHVGALLSSILAADPWDAEAREMVIEWAGDRGAHGLASAFAAGGYAQASNNNPCQSCASTSALLSSREARVTQVLAVMSELRLPAGRSLAAAAAPQGPSDIHARRRACKVIAALSGDAEPMIDTLGLLVKDHDSEVRRHAALALQRIGRPATSSTDPLAWPPA